MTSLRDLAADLTLALRLAEIADAISLNRYQALDLVVETKPDLTPVTDADKAVEEAIRKVLAVERPDDAVVGEEFGAAEEITSGASGKYYWVIDPIDGTKNFLRGVPTWATLIGLVDSTNAVVVGVVSSPALYRRWHAASGFGAFVTQGTGLTDPQTKQIKVSKVSELTDASISYSDLVGWGERRQKFIDLQEHVWRTRGLGDFWSHMLVAEGAVDIAVEPVLALWDMTPLDIIVREAGGHFTNISGASGSHGGSAVASNGLLHEAFLKAIN